MGPIVGALLGGALALGGCSVDTFVRRLPDASVDAGEQDAGRAMRDGGTPDACRPAVEACNGRDDDCDGRADEGFNLANDRANCGECGASCPVDPPRGSYRCVAGACELRCDRGHLECDGEPTNGCESITTAGRCGACDVACGGATPLCDASGTTAVCVARCPADTELCGDVCVDTRYSTAHCGACANACPDPPNAAPVCMAGRCSIACDDGARYANCDGDDENGCESLRSLTDCGACGTVCAEVNASASCASGACELACTPPYGDCDGMAATGCEASLTSLESCGFCGLRCDPQNAVGPTCATGRCGYGSCASGFGDCDATTANGCETNVRASAAHCGGCSQPCGSTMGTRQTCTDGLCYPMCGGAGCISPCNDCSCSTACIIGCAPRCSPTCSGASARCTVVADRRDRLDARCGSGATCTYSAQHATDVDVRCENAGTTCTAYCEGAASCEVICVSGASCTLFCGSSPSPACDFTMCEGTRRECGSGRVVCNRSC